MSVERHYLYEHNFLLTRIRGRLDDRSLQEHVAALTRESKGMPFLLELADCTELMDVGGLTGEGVKLAASLEEARDVRGRSKLAIVVPNEETYGLARIYEAISERHRSAVFVFRDYEEAVAWLGLDHLRLQIDELRKA